jgi:hypothetical protein
VPCTIKKSDFYLDSVNLLELVTVPEFDVVEHERPDVVAEPVRVQLLSLESNLDLDASRQSVVDRLVKLKKQDNQ